MLGCLLYELCTLEKPFKCDNLFVNYLHDFYTSNSINYKIGVDEIDNTKWSKPNIRTILKYNEFISLIFDAKRTRYVDNLIGWL